MGINDLRAKDIFFKYGGSHFYMEREGEYSEYKEYKISKEQEDRWIQEYQKGLLTQIKNDEIVQQNFNSLCTSIRQYKNLDYLKELVEVVIDKGQILDTFSIMLMAEGILGIVESLEKSNLGNDRRIIFARVSSINLLKSLLERPVVVSPKYLHQGYLIDLNDSQQILDRINDELENWI